jgi:NAD(P)-dependent dehydrogenase (short-subunit alcohol dehydrogenase family)
LEADLKNAGPIDTNMARGPIQTVMGPKYPGKKTDDELLALVAQNMPNRRMGQPEDVANMVSFLLCDLSVQIIGQVIAVAGGF